MLQHIGIDDDLGVSTRSVIKFIDEAVEFLADRLVKTGIFETGNSTVQGYLGRVILDTMQKFCVVFRKNIRRRDTGRERLVGVFEQRPVLAVIYDTNNPQESSFTLPAREHSLRNLRNGISYIVLYTVKDILVSLIKKNEQFICFATATFRIITA
jgi:hypothetical protein